MPISVKASCKISYNESRRDHACVIQFTFNNTATYLDKSRLAVGVFVDGQIFTFLIFVIINITIFILVIISITTGTIAIRIIIVITVIIIIIVIIVAIIVIIINRIDRYYRVYLLRLLITKNDGLLLKSKTDFFLLFYKVRRVLFDTKRSVFWKKRWWAKKRYSN